MPLAFYGCTSCCEQAANQVCTMQNELHVLPQTIKIDNSFLLWFNVSVRIKQTTTLH